MTSPLFPSFFPLFGVVLIVVMRRPVTMLKRRGAVSEETAQPLTDLRARDEERLQRLVRQGVVRATPDGRYYYDAAGQRALLRARLPLMIALLVTAFALAMGLGLWLSQKAPANGRPAVQTRAAGV